jgi:excisionase family DNA binding protein
MPVPSSWKADAARAAVAFEQRSWIPATALAAELGVSRRTIARWLRDERLAFPRPKVINRRLYFARGAVEAWKTAVAIKVAGGADG